MKKSVEVRDIKVSFGANTVLDGVSFTAHQGEALAVVGANGAGKTTLLKVMAGIVEPDAGGVILAGDNLDSLPRREVARRMAVVPQGAPQVFGYPLLEFILMGYNAKTGRFALPSQKQVDGARGALAALQLSELAHRPVSQLSGGEMQRALMARAMVAEAPLWLLDEPTASLDMGHQIASLQQMRRHVDQGGSVVAILHDLALIHRFFERVLVLWEGRFVADGPPDEVLSPEAVSSVFGVAMQRGEVDGKVVWVVE